MVILDARSCSWPCPRSERPRRLGAGPVAGAAGRCADRRHPDQPRGGRPSPGAALELIAAVE